MSDRPRLIIHLDLDAFYTAVEVLEKPELAGKPVVVGGRPEERGVVASASYAAREFGVRSAMPMSRALRLCPGAVVLPPRFDVYRQYSREVMAILRETSPLVEQMSIDEAYLDLTEQATIWEDGVAIARRLQARVKEEVGLSASLGVATNKLVAKVASDQDKPGGLTMVQPGKEAVFLAPLSVRVLWGVGPVTAAKLADMDVTLVGELAKVSEAELRARFGQHGVAMARHAQGIDECPVVTEHEAKSVSQERTFARDVSDAQTLEQHLEQFSHKVAQRLKRIDMVAKTVAVKLRYADFTTLTRQKTLTRPTNDKEEILVTAKTLLQRAWRQGRPVRLLGVAARQLSPPPEQLSFLSELAEESQIPNSESEP